MPERSGGYKTADIVLAELQTSAFAIRYAIKDLNIHVQRFPDDAVHGFFAPDDVAQIRQWLQEHQPPYRTVSHHPRHRTKKERYAVHEMLEYFFR